MAIHYVDGRYKIHYCRRTRNLRVFIFEKDTLLLIPTYFLLNIVYNHGDFGGLKMYAIR